MKWFCFLMIVLLLGCNDSATGTRPAQDNAQNKDTTVKDSLPK
jgi:hypothetical protein